jgi:hypothetical protein
MSVRKFCSQSVAPTSPLMTTQQTMKLYDALTLEINRADSLTGLLEDRLADLSEGDGPRELYALSLVAQAVSDKLQLILENARALHADPVKTGKRGAR